ncbi:MAG: hypothetical protein JXB49_09720 [Bacteroidales bacterium]|nr:hypothetical protein [Bacteroidales bacterium]
MKTEHVLEKYLLSHPEYWEFENEAEEVKRLRSLIHEERALVHFNAPKN